MGNSLEVLLSLLVMRHHFITHFTAFISLSGKWRSDEIAALTKAAWVRFLFPDSQFVSYSSRSVCWFSPALQEVSWVLQFFPIQSKSSSKLQ